MNVVTYQKNKKFMRLAFRLAIIIAAAVLFLLMSADFAYNFLALGIMAEALYSSVRMLISMRRAKKTAAPKRSNNRIIFVILLWLLSAVSFYCLYIVTENEISVTLSCAVITAALWILDWYFMYYTCIFRLIMRNKCCNTCRIYHFNYAMLGTPSLFIATRNPMSLIFIFLAIIHLLVGEIRLRKRTGSANG